MEDEDNVPSYLAWTDASTASGAVPPNHQCQSTKGN